MQILLGSLQQVCVAVLALNAAPFGIPATAFWIYVSATLVFIVGFLWILRELPREQGIEKVMPFGRLFFAMPLAAFGTEHFTITAGIAALVPRWIPAHTLWVYLVGAGFLCAALSIAVLVQARLAAALVGMTFVIFVLVMDLPAAVADPGNRFSWALALRQLAFSAGAFALAISLSSARPGQRSPAQPTRGLAAFPRFVAGAVSVFYGVEHLLHPEFLPGVPLKKLTPEWISGRLAVGYLVGVVLIAAGVCMLLNKAARAAATTLGITILLTVLFVYLPMVVRAPTDIVALNYFFDTMFFGGTILLVANAMGRKADLSG